MQWPLFAGLKLDGTGGILEDTRWIFQHGLLRVRGTLGTELHVGPVRFYMSGQLGAVFVVQRAHRVDEERIVLVSGASPTWFGGAAGPSAAINGGAAIALPLGWFAFAEVDAGAALLPIVEDKDVRWQIQPRADVFLGFGWEF